MFRLQWNDGSTSKLGLIEVNVFILFKTFFNSQTLQIYDVFYINTYLPCLFVCLSVSNKRQNGWSNQARICCGNLHDP